MHCRVLNTLSEEFQTAPVNFKDRVSKSDVFGEYIPNFKYYLVPVRKYSNAELLRKEDEISLIMMFNKIQTKEDVDLFLDEVSGDAMQKILKDTSDHILNHIFGVSVKGKYSAG